MVGCEVDDEAACRSREMELGRDPEHLRGDWNQIESVGSGEKVLVERERR